MRRRAPKRIDLWRLIRAGWIVAGLVLGLIGLSTSSGRLPPPVWAPVDRLLANAEAFVARNPTDAEGHYILGRIHHLAFMYGEAPLPATQRMRAVPGDGIERPTLPDMPSMNSNPKDQRWAEAERRARKKLGFSSEAEAAAELQRRRQLQQRYFALRSDYKQVLDEEGWTPPIGAAGLRARLGHAEQAIKNFREAIRLDSGASYYPLALASFAEDLDREASRAVDFKLPLAMQRLSAREIRDLLRKAVTLAAPPGHDWQKFSKDFNEHKDHEDGDYLQENIRFWQRHGVIYPEAARAFIRAASRPGARLSGEEKRFIAVVRVGLASRDEFDKHAGYAISPVIFSLAPVAGISGLLAPGSSVDFDLGGYGGRDRWPWVNPATAFIVWDPSHSARITSARQMFGTYTFGIPRENGYRALAALDDNADGMLTGSELQGIAVWFDVNGDGVSTPDEVTPVESLGITAIAARETGYEGIHPTNPHGLQLRDGRWLPTWDWMVAPKPRR